MEGTPHPAPPPAAGTSEASLPCSPRLAQQPGWPRGLSCGGLSVSLSLPLSASLCLFLALRSGVMSAVHGSLWLLWSQCPLPHSPAAALSMRHQTSLFLFINMTQEIWCSQNRTLCLRDTEWTKACANYKTQHSTAGHWGQSRRCAPSGTSRVQPQRDKALGAHADSSCGAELAGRAPSGLSRPEGVGRRRCRRVATVPFAPCNIFVS